MKNFGIFEILSSRRIQWCALMASSLQKKIYFFFRSQLWSKEGKIGDFFSSTNMEMMHVIGFVSMRGFQKYPNFSFLVKFWAQNIHKTINWSNYLPFPGKAKPRRFY
jgi:hypothetical protein